MICNGTIQGRGHALLPLSDTVFLSTCCDRVGGGIRRILASAAMSSSGGRRECERLRRPIVSIACYLCAQPCPVTCL
eukprot:COSAG01_NODE_32864_length_574_cov_0.703158_1_plen_77_part_00